MVKRNLIFILLIFLVFSFTLAGCNTKNTPAIRTVTDALGRKVTIPEKVSRIVCSGPGALRLVCYMDASNDVVGIEQCEKKWGAGGRPYALAHPEFMSLPIIGSGGPGAIGSGPDAELVEKVHPDVIFATYMEREEADKYQVKVGIPVVVLSYGRLATFYSDDIFESLAIVGKVLGKEKRANEVINFIKGALNDLSKRSKTVSQIAKPSVYVGGIGYKGMHGIDSTLSGYPPFQAVSACNVANGLGKKGMHFFIDKEQLIKWNPDYIFIDEGGYKLCMKDFKNPAFQTLKAVKDGNLYGLLPYNFYTTNIGTALADAYYVGKVLYPKQFKDVDPVKKADEIYTFLVGHPVYKEMKDEYGGFKKIELPKD